MDDREIIESFPVWGDIIYSMNYKGEKNYDFDITDIKRLIWHYECRNGCSYCGYGRDVFLMFKLKSGDYGYVSSWSGCLTYDKKPNSFYIADTKKDLVNICLTKYERDLYKDNKNKTPKIDWDD